MYVNDVRVGDRVRDRGKKERFERTITTHSADLFGYAMTLSRSRAMAEDLVQETFLRAWRSLHTLREEKSAKSWLLTTLRREYFRQFERYQPEFDDLDLDQIAAPADTSSNDTDTLRAAIFALPPIHRDVLALQVIFGYRGSEIGEILNLPRATVNTRLFRARQQLKHQVNGDERAAVDDDLAGGQ